MCTQLVHIRLGVFATHDSLLCFLSHLKFLDCEAALLSQIFSVASFMRFAALPSLAISRGVFCKQMASGFHTPETRRRMTGRFVARARLCYYLLQLPYGENQLRPHRYGKGAHRQCALKGLWRNFSRRRHLRLEGRCVIPARSSVHGLSCSRRLSPPSGRNSTYRPVQICESGSETATGNRNTASNPETISRIITFPKISRHSIPV
jgi:hypothetical protein